MSLQEFLVSDENSIGGWVNSYFLSVNNDCARVTLVSMCVGSGPRLLDCDFCIFFLFFIFII